MNDYIDRQAAIDAVAKGCQEWLGIFERCKENILSLPPAEVVEVVRCKYCRWGREVCGNIECSVDSNVPPEYHGYEWFCPNGERSTDE